MAGDKKNFPKGKRRLFLSAVDESDKEIPKIPKKNSSYLLETMDFISNRLDNHTEAWAITDDRIDTVVARVEDVVGYAKEISKRGDALSKRADIATERLIALESRDDMSSFSGGVFSVLFIQFMVTFILTVFGYSEADKHGKCQNAGRNRAVVFMESSMFYEFGCKMGKRLDGK